MDNIFQHGSEYVENDILMSIFHGKTPRQSPLTVFSLTADSSVYTVTSEDSHMEEIPNEIILMNKETPPKEPRSSCMSEADSSCDVNVADSKKTSTEYISEEESDGSDISWPDFEIPGTWGTYGLEDDPWNDNDKPCVHFKNYEDLELTPTEVSGVLTERIIASCSSYLDRCPQTGKYVLCKCILRQKNLSNISILTFHHYLQYLDLSWNRLTDLRALGQMPFLMYLNVSHNMLTDVLYFKPPFNLTYVNFSHNYADIIPDLSGFWSIIYLDLSYNQIYQISGLESLKYLRYLDLSHNKIKILSGLNNMKITHLNLECNEISTFEEGSNTGLHTLRDLIVVNMSNNHLKCLRLLENAKVLQKLILMNNNISCLYELEYLSHLRYLAEVYFKGNPISTDKNYYELCVKCITSIILLDGEYVSAEDKVLVKSKYKPTPFIASSKNHADLFLLEQLANCEVTNMILPINRPPPAMIVLVGPPGSGQKRIIREFYEKFKKQLCLGISHTTRPRNSNETEGLSYYYISEEKFEDMVRNAEFLTVSNILGYAYGFAFKELAKATEENKVLLLHTDIVGALNLRMRNLRPYLVLTLFLQNEGYYAQLLRKYYYTYWISRDFKALRIINDSAKVNSPSNSEISVEIEEMLDNMISNLPVKDQAFKKSSVKFAEHTAPTCCTSNTESYIRTDETLNDDELSSLISDEMVSFIIDIKKKEGPSFNFDDEDVFHSISEVEFDFEPMLSVVSDHKIDEDVDETMHDNSRRMRPSQRREDFIQSILAARRYYVDFHRQNPGIFCETVFADKVDATMLKLEQLLKKVLNRPPNAWHSYSFEKDPLFEKVVQGKLTELHMELESRSHLKVEQCD
ncbi:hypothetical protein Trydic_g19359 [Trypoxylus dichotomus]